MTNNGDDDGDAALVRATLAGRAEAFGRLYDRYAPLVRAICFDVTGDLTHAQDLSQDAFVRAYPKLARLRQPDRFGAWLVGITRHVCREWRRSRRRGRWHLRRASERADGPAAWDAAAAPADPAGGDDDLMQLRQAIAALPQTEREALHLFYLQEQPADAAARVLGLSRSGFYRALERAKERLRRLVPIERPPGVTR